MSKARRVRGRRGTSEPKTLGRRVREQMLCRLNDMTDERLSAPETEQQFWEFIDWADRESIRYALVLWYLVDDVMKIQQVLGHDDRLWSEMLSSAPNAWAKEVLRHLTDACVTGPEQLMDRLLDAFEHEPYGPVRLLVGVTTCVVGAKCSLGGWFSAGSPAA